MIFSKQIEILQIKSDLNLVTVNKNYSRKQLVIYINYIIKFNIFTIFYSNLKHYYKYDIL